MLSLSPQGQKGKFLNVLHVNSMDTQSRSVTASLNALSVREIIYLEIALDRRDLTEIPKSLLKSQDNNQSEIVTEMKEMVSLIKQMMQQMTAVTNILINLMPKPTSSIH